MKLNIVKKRTMSFEKIKKDFEIISDKMVEVNTYWGLHYTIPDYSYTEIANEEILKTIYFVLYKMQSKNKNIDIVSIQLSKPYYEDEIVIKSNYNDFLEFSRELIELLGDEICNIGLK